MNSLWDIRIFLGLVPKESHCISGLHVVFETEVFVNFFVYIPALCYESTHVISVGLILGMTCIVFPLFYSCFLSCGNAYITSTLLCFIPLLLDFVPCILLSNKTVFIEIQIQLRVSAI